MLVDSIIRVILRCQMKKENKENFVDLELLGLSGSFAAGVVAGLLVTELVSSVSNRMGVSADLSAMGARAVVAAPAMVCGVTLLQKVHVAEGEKVEVANKNLPKGIVKAVGWFLVGMSVGAGLHYANEHLAVLESLSVQ